jgi:hypothetical protein
MSIFVGVVFENAFASSVVDGAFMVEQEMTVEGSTLSVGGLFSVGTSSFVVMGGRVGVATASPSESLDVAGGLQSSSMTLSSVGNAVFSVGISSGLRVLGGTLKLSPGTSIKWPDGTSSTTSNFILATATSVVLRQPIVISSGTTWQSMLGSSLTLAMSGRRALASFTCPIEVGGNGDLSLGLLVDGMLVDGQEVIKGLNLAASPGGSSVLMSGFDHLTESTYSGNTSFSLVGHTANSGSGITLNQAQSSLCQFFVREM